MKKNTSLFIFLTSLLFLCNSSYAQKYTVASAATITGTSSYCSNRTSDAYSDNWTACTGTGTGTETVSYTWMADGAGIYGSTFNAGAGGGTVTLPAAAIPASVMTVTGTHQLQVFYTWSSVSGCSGTVTASPTFFFTVTPTSAPSASAYTISPTHASITCGGHVNLSSIATMPNYAWSPAAGLSATTGQTVNAMPVVTTTYTVTTIFSPGCAVHATSIVMVADPSVAPLTGPSYIGIGQTSGFSDATGGGTWSSSNAAVATISSTGHVTGISSGTATVSYILSSCSASYATASVIVGDLWTGAVSTDWNTTGNWATGVIPTYSVNAIIPSVTNQPVVGGSSGSHDLVIESGTTVTISSGATLGVYGNLINNGTELGAGRLLMNGGSILQTITGIGTVTNLSTDDDVYGVTIGTPGSLTDMVNVTGVLKIDEGFITTNSLLTLISNASGTASIGACGGSAVITGNVIVQQYIPGGRRAYRFFSHPYNAAIELYQLCESTIDITGAGPWGAPPSGDGFTETTANTPSCYYTTGLDGDATIGSTPDGWVAESTAVVANFNPFQGIALYYRGSKGEGLSGGTYTISPSTFSMTGNVNVGTQNVPLTYSGSYPWNLVGNPYPSPVDIGTVIYNASVAGSVTGSAFYVWNPYLSTDGQYEAKTISNTPYYLEGCTAFLVEASTVTGTQLTFAESNKSTTISEILLREQPAQTPQYISLYIYDTTYHPFDMLYLSFNDNATDAKDGKYDAGKPPSLADLNFYSISSDSAKLNIDARPYVAGKVIPLGINSNLQQPFIIKVTDMPAIAGGGELYLHDNYLGQYTKLQQGAEYRFAITADAASQGKKRFELTTGIPAQSNLADKALEVAIVPNPATNEVTVSYTASQAANTIVRIINAAGNCVSVTNLGAQQTGSASIRIGTLPAGMYEVEVTSGDQKTVKQLIKE